MLSDEWLPRYGLKQNLKEWRDWNGNGNGNADAKVTTIALPVLCTGELKITFHRISDDLKVQIIINDIDNRKFALANCKYAPTTTAQSWSVPRKDSQTEQRQ